MAVNDRWAGTASALAAAPDRSRWPGTGTASIDYGAVADPVASPLVMFFGDSRSVQKTLAVAIDSRTNPREMARHPLNVWQARYGARAMVAAAGRGGDTSAQYLTEWPTVRAQTPRFVFFLGIVNDLNFGLAAGAPLAAADGSIANAAFARLRLLADEVRTWGGTPVFCTEPLGAAANQEARIAEAAIFDGLITASATANGLPILNVRDIIRDPSSTSTTVVHRAGFSYDNLHFSERGGYAIAVNGMAPILNTVWPTATPYIGPTAQTATQGLANPALTATGGSVNAGVTGTAPGSWTADLSGAAGASATIALEARGDGQGNDAVLAYTTTAAAQQLRLRQDVTTALTTALAAAPNGLRVRFQAEVQITSPGALRSLACLVLGTIGGTAGATLMSAMEAAASGDATVGPTEAWSYRIVSDWVTIAPGTTLASMSLRFLLTAAGAGTTTARIGVTSLDMVAL